VALHIQIFFIKLL